MGFVLRQTERSPCAALVAGPGHEKGGVCAEEKENCPEGAVSLPLPLTKGSLLPSRSRPLPALSYGCEESRAPGLRLEEDLIRETSPSAAVGIT